MAFCQLPLSQPTMIFLIARKEARYITRGDMVIITDLNKIGNFSNMTPMNLHIL